MLTRIASKPLTTTSRRHARYGICLLAMHAGLVASPAAGQAPVHTGDRVRVTVDAEIHSGLLLAMENDSIVMDDRGDTIRIARAAVQTFEVSLGEARWASAAYGAFLGGTIVGGAAWLVLKDVEDFLQPIQRDVSASTRTTSAGKTGLLGGALLGGTIGFALGALFPSERWSIVDLSARLDVVPGPSGVRLRMSTAW